MKPGTRLLSLVLSLAMAGQLFASEPLTLDEVLTGNHEVDPATVANFRVNGSESFERLTQRYAEVLALVAQQQSPVELDISCSAMIVDDYEAQAKRLADWVDAVGGAKYCTASRLFWHTDLEKAKAVALRTNKPILSLRMLGNLSDELSCANSRFFRTTLYANEEISKLLREKYVLHWKSVRPVPKITIDFGDGRRIERTITGNSAHYVLLHDGTVVDALPGLYGPQAFLARLSQLSELSEGLTSKDSVARRTSLVNYHEREEQSIRTAWRKDLAQLGVDPTAGAVVKPAIPQTRPPQAINANGPPHAIVAAKRAVTKSVALELPALAAMQSKAPIAAESSLDELERTTTDEVWQRIAALHLAEAELDAASRELIRKQHPTAAVAAKIAITKARVESPLVKMIRGLENSVALDSVQNEYRLHRKIHEWFTNGAATNDVEALNERVYAELFLTPSSDPWLGLSPSDAYAALPENGVSLSPPAASQTQNAK